MNLITPSAEFSTCLMQGPDSAQFLQGQVTLNVEKLLPTTPDLPAQHTAICDLKGRVQFDLWLQNLTENTTNPCYRIILASAQAELLKAHIKKYAAFSKLTLSAFEGVYPTMPALELGMQTFGMTPLDAKQLQAWALAHIQRGQYWLSHETAGLFQPQELRLHQQGGVDYDKGCYLGQEIIARLYFRAQPKQWLHHITGTGTMPQAGTQLEGAVQVINAVTNALDTAQGWHALVIGRPDTLTDWQIIDLPQQINGSVARLTS